MQAPRITPLLGTLPATPGAKAQPAAAAAFGDMLSRELGNRQAPHGETAQRPTQAPPAPAERSRRPAPVATPASGAGADAASIRMRQENQRAQDQRDGATQVKAKAAERDQVADAVGAASANAVHSTGADSGNRGTGPTSTSTAKANDKTAGHDDADATETAGTAGAEANAANAVDAAGAASGGAAAAALLALVNGLAPRPAGSSAPAVADGPADPKLAAQKSKALLSIGSPELAGDETAASDPAFDALLAQASQAREAMRSAGGERKPPPGIPQATAGNPNAVGAVPVDLAAKAEATLAQPTAAQAAFERDAGHLLDAAVPSAATAIGTAATAGVLPGGSPDGAESLAPRVGTPAWDNALGQKVVWMAAGAEQSASLTLNPPDLGPLQVVINVSNSHAEATFTAAQPEVRQALEAAMPKLKEMLADAGISLGQTSVGAGSPDQGSGQQQPRRAGSAGTAGLNTDGATAQPLRTNRRGTAGNGLVDTFA